MQKATAIRISGEFSIDSLTIDSVEVPRPAQAEVTVDIKAVSLNYRDLLVATGRYNPRLTRPLILGSDAAGEVVAVGSGVTDFKIGDRVVGAFFQNWPAGEMTADAAPSALGGAIDGVFTTARNFSQHGLLAIPEHLSFEQGATLPCAGVTAWHGLVPTAHLGSGDTVLLLGTGGVSLFGLQFASMHGARAIITSSSDEKLKRAAALGATDTINYVKVPEWNKQVMRLTGGRGVDVVLEVGGAGTLGRSMRSVRPGGQVSVIGVLAGISEPLNIGPAIHSGLRLQGIYVGSMEMFRAMNRAITQHRTVPVVDRVFSFTEFRDAFGYLQSGKQFGKIVIRTGE